jgi:general secretion pathway protein D
VYKPAETLNRTGVRMPRGRFLYLPACAAMTLAAAATAPASAQPAAPGPPAAGRPTAATTRPAAAAARPATGPAAAMVELNLPPDVELRVVVDYLAKRLGLNVIYDEKVDNKRVTLAAGAKVPAAALPGLLDAVLKAKGLALVDAQVRGWKRVVAVGDPGGDVQVASIPATHMDAGELAQEVRRLLAARLKAQGLPAGATTVDVSADARSRQVIVIGPAAQVSAARDIAKLIDLPVDREETPVKFYKLANTTAADVLETIRSLDGDARPAAAGGVPGAGGAGGTYPPAAPVGTTRPPFAAGNGRSPAAGTGGGSRSTFGGAGGLASGGGGITTDPTGSATGVAGGIGTSGGLANGSTLAARGTGAGGSSADDVSRGGAAGAGFGAALGTGGPSPSAAEPVRSRLATVAADANTNSIIVVGPPAAQRLYENLIRQLDRRRPQVLVESTVVTLDTTKDFQFGVEIAGRRNGDTIRRFVFSSFGFSEANPQTGQLSVLPGKGLNGALLAPEIADLVVRALLARGNSRIVASPRVLVNDNATGTLFSIAEQPFTAVNANNTISTTSFGGYAEAGTEITLTPHISEKDYLQLEYEVALSSFTGQSANGIPPPRQTNKIASQVTIPDGSTIVVGGLNRAEENKTVDSVPILGDLPLVGFLFRSTQDTSRNSTLFVFIRPIILRDDEFEDLRFLSDRDARQSRVADRAPASEPLLVE